MGLGGSGCCRRAEPHLPANGAKVRLELLAKGGREVVGPAAGAIGRRPPGGLELAGLGGDPVCVSPRRGEGPCEAPPRAPMEVEGRPVPARPHHITPRSRGGTHEPDGLTLLCWFHHHVVVHHRGFTIDPNRHPVGTLPRPRPHPSPTRRLKSGASPSLRIDPKDSYATLRSTRTSSDASRKSLRPHGKCGVAFTVWAWFRLGEFKCW